MKYLEKYGIKTPYIDKCVSVHLDEIDPDGWRTTEGGA